MKLLGICGSPSIPSRTLNAVEKTLDFAKEWDKSLSIETVNIRDCDIPFCDSRDPQLYEGDAKKIISKIVECNGLVVGTPIYRGAYTGIIKNLFDIIPNNSLQGKPVGIIVTGKTDHHYLSIEHMIKPLIGFFHAHVIPGAVYINHKYFIENELINEGILIRLKELAKVVVEFARQLPPDLFNLVGPPGPEIKRIIAPVKKTTGK